MNVTTFLENRFALPLPASLASNECILLAKSYLGQFDHKVTQFLRFQLPFGSTPVDSQGYGIYMDGLNKPM